MRQTAEQWAEEGRRKYGTGAVAWLGRWKVNFQDYPEDLAVLDQAIALLTTPPADTATEGWRCFHCNSMFTNRAAAEAHFGTDPGGTTICIADLRAHVDWLTKTIESQDADKKLLDWWEGHRNYEHGIDYDTGQVVMYQVTGSVNDREWNETGRGNTLRAAIYATVQTLRARDTVQAVPRPDAGTGEAE